MFLCEWASCVERNALFLVAASACRLGLSADFFPPAAFLRRVILVGSVLSETSSCRPQSKGPEGTAGYSKMVADTLWKKKILRWMRNVEIKIWGLYFITISAVWDTFSPLLFFLSSLPLSFLPYFCSSLLPFIITSSSVPSLFFFIRGVVHCAGSVNVTAPVFIFDSDFPSCFLREK